MFLAAMDGDSPSRRKEKRSKHNQDRAATPKLTGHTKAAYPHDGAGGFHTQAKRARGHGAQGLAAVPPPPSARAFAGDDPIVDAEEEALERPGRTIVTEVMSTLSRGPVFFSELVIFMVLCRSYGSPNSLLILLMVSHLLCQLTTITGSGTSGP